MARSKTIDNLKGIAFILMFIFHLFSLYDATVNTSYHKNTILNIIGIISRTLFILLAGYSLNASYKKYNENFIKERTKQSLKILVHALIITLLTYILYPEKFIKFGVLHFICLITLLSPLFIPYKNITIILFIISIFINYPKINEILDTITGYQVHSRMMDWFPLKKYLPLLLLGVIIGQNMDISNNKVLEQDIPLVTNIGKNTLNLYTIHFVVISIIYNIILKN